MSRRKQAKPIRHLEDEGAAPNLNGKTCATYSYFYGDLYQTIDYYESNMSHIYVCFQNGNWLWMSCLFDVHFDYFWLDHCLSFDCFCLHCNCFCLTFDYFSLDIGLFCLKLGQFWLKFDYFWLAFDYFCLKFDYFSSNFDLTFAWNQAVFSMST